MTAQELIKSWSDFSREKDFNTLPHVTEEKRLAKREEIFQEGIKRKPALKKATTRSKTVPHKKSTSKAAFKSNVAKEIKEGGKPVKQAVAIAYAVKREAAKKTVKAKK